MSTARRTTLAAAALAARVSRASLAALVSQAALAALASQAALAQPGQSLAAARLDGQFTLSGRVTVAVNVRGERVGQLVTRTWTFSSSCPTGACPAVRLARARSAGIDQLTLRQRAPAYYTGTGQFYAPLTCAGRAYARGEVVPFTITVRITAATTVGALVQATEIKATYTNKARMNLTPCVAAQSRDAATYSGRLGPTPASPSSPFPASGRSPAGS